MSVAKMRHFVHRNRIFTVQGSKVQHILCLLQAVDVGELRGQVIHIELRVERRAAGIPDQLLRVLTMPKR